MDIDFVAEKKNHITISGSENGTTSGIQDVNTLSDSFTWVVTNNTFAWIKLNVFTPEVVNRIVLNFTGTAGQNFTAFIIERSLDGFVWETLSASFTPDDNKIDVIYTTPTDFTFIRITVINPFSFSITNFEVYGPAEFQNDVIISHTFLRMYGRKRIDAFPRLPEFTKQTLRMLEGNNQLNLKLFDATLFTNSSISKSSVGDVVTFTPNNIPVLANSFYVWDFDENLLESDPDYDENNLNIVTELQPAVKTYTYQKVGLHVTRLFIRHPKYILEFTESFDKTS